MDPLTHAIVGLGVAALCGEPLTLTSPAVIGCITGAVIPDGDIIAQLKGDYVYLKHHRGASHSLVAAVLFSGVIAGGLWLLFGGAMLSRIFMMTFLGYLSHILLDATNSYGAQLLWPFYRKKVAVDLLLIYDPVLILLSVMLIIPAIGRYIPHYFSALLFLYYLSFRNRMRKKAGSIVADKLSGKYAIKALRVIPSMANLIKWHYILITDKEKIVGEVFVYSKKFNILKVLPNIDAKLSDIANNTPLARFFREFTPIYHINCKQRDGKYIFEFVDLRYYIAKDFLHHATAVIKRNFDSSMGYEIVTSLFHPYTKNKNVIV